MKYSILIVTALALCLLANPAYAWPEPKYYGRVVLISPVDGGWQTGMYLGQRWPEYVSNALIINLGAPPELDNMKAYRWYQAMPAARPRLAELWHIPKETAIEYGANYIEIGKGWADASGFN